MINQLKMRLIILSVIIYFNNSKHSKNLKLSQVANDRVVNHTVHKYVHYQHPKMAFSHSVMRKTACANV